MPYKNPEDRREYARRRYAKNRPASRKYSRQYYAANGDSQRRRRNKYNAENMLNSGMASNRAGAVGEHIVAADLYSRGALEITWPDDPHGPDDMHAHFSSGWFSVQAKCGRENKKTGMLGVTGLKRRKISSHVLAVVGVRSGKVRYLPNARELPEELRATV